MSTRTTPRLGKTVLYTLTELDAKQIVSDRLAAGRASARGNDPIEGDTYPAMIVREFIGERSFTERHLRSRAGLMETESGIAPTEEQFQARVDTVLEDQLANSVVNLQVFLDGIDVFWATSRSEFNPEKHGRWVQHVGGRDLPMPEASPLGTPEERAELGVIFQPSANGHWSEAFDGPLTSW